MKTTRQALPSLLVLCSALAVPSASGQTIYTWTNSADGDLATSTNWDPNGIPFIGSATVAGDTMLFDGRTTGPIWATSNTGAQTGSSVGNPLAGIYIHLTANQTNPVTFHTTVANTASSGIRFNGIVIDAGAGSFTLGHNSTTNALDTIWGTYNPMSHGLTNNSANPAIISQDVRFRMGAGGAHTFVFGGTGDWHVTNDFHTAGAALLVQKVGAGILYLTAGHNAFSLPGTGVASPLIISGGALVLKSGGMLAPATTINNSGALVLDAPASSQAGGAQTISSPIHGTGTLEVKTGTLTLSGANDYTGLNIVSNGMLIINSNNAAAETFVYGGTLGGAGTFSGPVTVLAGGTLAPGASVGTLTVSNDLSLGGNLAIELNKSLPQSNDVVVVSGLLTNTGTDTLTVSNLGPALSAGDKFTLFNKPLQNGAALTVTGAGATWVNDLAVDGSIRVATVSVPSLHFSQAGNSLQFSWDTTFGAFRLQAQTNDLGVGLSQDWFDYSGGNPVFVPIDADNGAVLFRLVSP